MSGPDTPRRTLHAASQEASAGQAGWCTARLPGGRGFLVRPVRDGWEAFPEAPRLARDMAGHHKASLTLILNRAPRKDDPALEPLIDSGTLALTCSFALDEDEQTRLEALLGGWCRPFYVQAGSTRLQWGEAMQARGTPLGSGPQCWLGTSLPAAAAVEVMRALRGEAPLGRGLHVSTELYGAGVPVIRDVPLSGLLGGLGRGPEAARHLAIIVVGSETGEAVARAKTPTPSLEAAPPSAHRPCGATALAVAAA